LSFDTIYPREAREIWDSTKRLREEARIARRGGWFPVLLFGVAALGSSPFYLAHLCGSEREICFSDSALTSDFATVHPVTGFGGWLSVYWMAASAGVFGLTVGYYHHRGRRTGIQGRTWPMVGTGAVMIAFVLMVGAWLGGWPFFIGNFGTEPLLIVGISLLALARTERSGTLAVLALTYVAIVVPSLFYNYINLFGRFGLRSADEVKWSFLPNILVPGLYLIGASLVLKRSTRRRRPTGGEFFG